MIRDKLIIQRRELDNKLQEKYLERDVDKRKFENDLIKVIIGPRRAGKSFFAMHIMNDLGRFAYVNFDDEQLSSLKNYDNLIAELESLYDKPTYLFFDEIQNLPKWELFVNRLHRQGYNLILTGSNSKLLSKELATHLTGRHTVINIFPLSFKEYLKKEAKELTSTEKKAKLSSYVLFGGYPEPLIKNLDYTDYLSTLFNSILYRDIVKRFKIRFPDIIENISYQLISNIAKEFSYNSLAKIGNLKSVYTVEKYLSYLEESFIFFKVNKFSYKVREQISSNKKIYCIDNGFIYAKAFKLSPDIGRLYENTVAIELLRRFGNDFYYWKNPQQEEVDFVIKEGLKISQLIQVCYDISNIDTKKREIRSLLKAGRELNCNNLLIITEDYEAEEQAEWFGMKGKIMFIPLWKWLLEN